MRRFVASACLAVGLATAGCATEQPAACTMLDQYAVFTLTADLSPLTDHQQAMLPILIDAAREMDGVFWEQAYGNRDMLLSGLTSDTARCLADANYGPWDRLGSDAPLFAGVGPKPAGANLYPADLTADEFTAYVDAHPDQADALRSLYTLVRRDGAAGLSATPYHVAFAAQHEAAAAKLREAAALADNPALRRYLELRADALLSDDYRASDMAWLDMKDNTIDIVIGPIETYEDQLMGLKAAHEAYVLIKDQAWSARLARYATLLPALQRGLPVPDRYKQETPGTESELNAYDVIFYAGEANAGSKTIAINLPNDEDVQLAKGTRRLQLKNAVRAKFDSILVPIADLLIAEDQRQYITFDAFFGNTMFHEVAHGLGIKNTVNGRGTVRQALREHASSFEEGKADILGLSMLTSLRDQGEVTEGRLEDNYVTFLASIFRSVRFGATSAHGRANMVRFHFLRERGAFARDDATGTYRVDFARMREAMAELSRLLLTLQGNGDYDGAGRLLAERGIIDAGLQADLDRVGAARIPVDMLFEQGIAVLRR
ncbi:MAG TPA: hypothetical protein VGA37_02295 [Gemmatimonadales bacterium]